MAPTRWEDVDEATLLARCGALGIDPTEWDREDLLDLLSDIPIEER